MSVLLREIKGAFPKAAYTLERADFRTDSDIQSLTREDLHELFPGSENLKMRRAISEIIHKQRPIGALLKELKDFIPQESFRAALTSNGVLVDYLNIMKDMKSQIDKVQSFFDAHIGLLEDLSKTPPGAAASAKGKSAGHPQGAHGSLSSTSISSPCGEEEPHNGQMCYNPQGTYGTASGSRKSSSSEDPCKGKSEGYPQGAHGERSRYSPQHYKEVMYQTVVSGETFGAHVQLMDTVKTQVKDAAVLTECSQDSKVVIVFCPICSRVGTDVGTAMAKASGDKPVILVLMHYTREVKAVPSQRTWSDYPNIVWHVNIFYHDMMHGLLKCQENNDAACEIQKQLLEYSVPRVSTGSTGSISGRGRDTGSGSRASGQKLVDDGGDSSSSSSKHWFSWSRK